MGHTSGRCATPTGAPGVTANAQLHERAGRVVFDVVRRAPAAWRLLLRGRRRIADGGAEADGGHELLAPGRACSPGCRSGVELHGGRGGPGVEGVGPWP